MTLTGVMPVAPTVFTDAEELDLEGQRRVVDYLIDAESVAICVLANYSEQFSLDDRERDLVMNASLDQAAERVPVVVTTSHFSARVAAERSRRAQEAGAAMVMLMPPFFGATVRCSEAEVYDYFARVADGLDIDIMLQDAPMSPTPLSVDLIRRLARDIPQIRYAKIEVPRAAAKIRELVASTPDLPGVFDGEESVTLIPDLEAGAVGTMCSALMPDLLAPVVANFLDGEREVAADLWEHVLPVIHYENRQCGLRAAKFALAAGGVITSDKCREPFDVVPDAARDGLLELLRRRDPLVMRWA